MRVGFIYFGPLLQGKKPLGPLKTKAFLHLEKR